MKPEHIQEQRQSAGRMESVMLIASGVGAVTAVLVVLKFGCLLGIVVFLLSLICFALSKVFDLLADVLNLVAQDKPNKEP